MQIDDRNLVVVTTQLHVHLQQDVCQKVRGRGLLSDLLRNDALRQPAKFSIQDVFDLTCMKQLEKELHEVSPHFKLNCCVQYAELGMFRYISLD
jgi:hypothetical protein